ncbi:alpha/beta fold hydrolase [Glaciibacter sp. 2TAF33]|uniref:alpha/beta fold hydrolase n=1 Tax=Glaciibacter sp. 2TAF33 TaxID=3233015 RepID=UPI003F93D183
MSIWVRRSRRGEVVVDEELALLDAAIADRDWTVVPDGARLWRFPAPSGSLAVTSLGDPARPRVVLVPGATGSAEDFLLLAPLLVAAGYYVESYDLAGQYRSAAAGPPEGERYSYDLFVGDLIAFLEAGSRPAHVLGYSFAGIVAQIAYARCPDLFATLAFLGVPPQPGQTFRGVRWIGPLSYVIPEHTIGNLLIWGIVTNQNHVPPGRLDLVRMRFEHTSRQSIDDIVRLMRHTPDLRGVLAAGCIPLLVAVGHRDLWPSGLHHEFAASIGARLCIYRTGHSPCETTPHQLARDLLALYDRAP